MADGIYSKWVTLVNTIAHLIGNKEQVHLNLLHEKYIYINTPTVLRSNIKNIQNYKTIHEAIQKDIERVVGVSHARFHLVREPAVSFSIAELKNIMKICIILYNMIVEDERDRYDYNKKETFKHEQAPFAVEESYLRDGVAKVSVIQRNKD